MGKDDVDENGGFDAGCLGGGCEGQSTLLASNRIAGCRIVFHIVLDVCAKNTHCGPTPRVSPSVTLHNKLH